MKRREVVVIFSLFFAGVGLTRAATTIPEVLEIGREESLPGDGRLSSIAVDSKDQPHITCDGGANLIFYDKIGGAWRGLTVNMSSYGYQQFYNPHVEIMSNDVLWVSGILVGPLGIFSRENVAVAPTAPAFAPKTLNAQSWDTGNLSIDQSLQEVTAWGSAGYYQSFVYDAASATRTRNTTSGRMYCGVGGEANVIWISRAGAVRHGNGKTQSVWHLATEAHAGYGYSYYQNSLRYYNRQSSVGWADPNYFRGMGTDGAYCSIMGDNKELEVAYIACDLSSDGGQGGTYVNVFNKTAMVYPLSTMFVVDPVGASGLRRFAPQWAACNAGGAFLTWTRSGRIKIRYFAPDGTPGPEVDITAGGRSSMCMDKQGNLHLAYNGTGGMKYRKIAVSGQSQQNSGIALLTNPCDFDGDGADEATVYDPSTGNWFIHNLNWVNPPGVVRNWGFPGVIPAPADYTGDKKADLGVYDPLTGNWYIQSLDWGNVGLIRQWGFPGVISCPADFTGDGKADLCVYDTATGKWYIQSLDWSSGGVVRLWGFVGAIPVPGDYTGDGKADLAVYNPNNGDWYILNLDWGTQGYKYNWGFAGAIPVPADYTGDGQTDLAVFNLATGDWYIHDLKWLTPPTGIVVNFGYAGVIPMRGNFDGVPNSDYGVYNPSLGIWGVSSLYAGYAKVFQWGYPGVIPIGGWYLKNYWIYF